MWWRDCRNKKVIHMLLLPFYSNYEFATSEVYLIANTKISPIKNKPNLSNLQVRINRLITNGNVWKSCILKFYTDGVEVPEIEFTNENRPNKSILLPKNHNTSYILPIKGLEVELIRNGNQITPEKKFTLVIEHFGVPIHLRQRWDFYEKS